MDRVTLPILEGTTAEWIVGRIWRSAAEPVQASLDPKEFDYVVADWPTTDLQTRIIVSPSPTWLLEAWYRGGALFEAMLRGRFSFGAFLSGAALDEESSAALEQADNRGREEARGRLNSGSPRFNASCFRWSP